MTEKKTKNGVPAAVSPPKVVSPPAVDGTSRGGHKMTRLGSARVIELIVTGLSDVAIITRLQKEGFLEKGDILSETTMYRYRAKPEAKPSVRHMTLRAQQLGSVAYSEAVLNTIRIMRASGKKLLMIDAEGDDMINESLEDSRMVKALTDAHFKAQHEIMMLFTPEVRAEEGEDANALLETALVEMVEGLAEKARERRQDKNRKASANQDNNQEE